MGWVTLVRLATAALQVRVAVVVVPVQRELLESLAVLRLMVARDCPRTSPGLRLLTQPVEQAARITVAAAARHQRTRATVAPVRVEVREQIPAALAAAD